MPNVNHYSDDPRRLESSHLCLRKNKIFLHTWFRRGAMELLAIAVTMFIATPAFATLITGSETVSGKRTTSPYSYTLPDGSTESVPAFEWDYKYVRSFDGKVVSKDVQIAFAFDAGLGYTNEQKTAYKSQIEKNIEGIWNNKYSLYDSVEDILIPLVVDVTLTGPFDQTVTVKPGSGRANMTTWYVNDSASVNAHEFGHMLGLYDEYLGGAVDKYPNPTLSDIGLMGLGALNPNPKMLPRYYQQYLDYMTTLNGDKFELRKVPEPMTMSLLGIGIAVLAWLRRRRLKTPLAEPVLMVAR